MGWQAITDAYAASRSLHLRLAESSLLVALAFHKNDQTGLCFPSFDSLIEETGMNLRTLRGSLKKLVELGLVSYSRERIGAPTRYSLRLPTVQKCTVQKDTVQIYTVQKGTSQGADLPPDTVQKCTPNREVNKEPKQEEGSAAIPRAHAAPKRRAAITHLLELTELPGEWRDYCAQVRPDLDPDRVWTSFRFYWTSGRGSGTRRSDKSWNSTWQTWVRNESESKAPVHQETPEEFGKRIAREMQEEERERQLSLQAMDGRNEYV